MKTTWVIIMVIIFLGILWAAYFYMSKNDQQVPPLTNAPPTVEIKTLQPGIYHVGPIKLGSSSTLGQIASKIKH